MLYRFDQFEIDDREFRFSNALARVPVEPKALRLLIYLIQNRTRLVPKQELLDKVWPDAVVTENALTREIVLLRKALDEDSRIPRYIETVPTVGYRFIANVMAVEQQPALDMPVSEKSVSASRMRSLIWVIVSVLLLSVASTSTVLYLRHRTRVLTEQDTVVLADFENSTGDPVFDETLRQGMAIQLEQSPFLSLIQDDRIQEVLREMGQPAGTRLTPSVAREVCVRTGSVAVLTGSIAPLGSQYVIGLRARDCQSGKVLADEQVQAARKEDVLHALDQVAGRFRTQIGESLSTVKKYDTPLSEATTRSLEALKAYSLGQKMTHQGANFGALPYLSRAVELDPDFARAYASMAAVYAHVQQPERAAEMLRKAYPLRKNVSERERLWIEVSYYRYVTGEMEKAVSSLELLQQVYPRDPDAYSNLANTYAWLGNSEKALELATQAHRLDPAHFQNLASYNINLNRLDEADAIYRQMEERGFPVESWARSKYLYAFLKGDDTQMAQLAALAVGKRGEDTMFRAQADTEAWHGRLNSSREFNRRAVNSALKADARETAAAYLAYQASIEANFGDRAKSRADAAEALKMAPNRMVRETAALALARTGDSAAAEKLAAGLDKDFPLDTMVQRNRLPVIRAAIALDRNQPAQAVEVLKITSDIELGSGGDVGSRSMGPVYMRGEAYLMLHDGGRAAAEFQKFIDHYGLVRNSPCGPLARLGLARAFAMQGDTTKARAAYQDFLALWKDADSDIPLLQQAKAEYARL